MSSRRRHKPKFWFDNQARLTIGWNSAANAGDFLLSSDIENSARGFYGLIQGFPRDPLNLKRFVVVLNTGTWRGGPQKRENAHCFKVSLKKEDFLRLIHPLHLGDEIETEFIAQSDANHPQLVPNYYADAPAWEECRKHILSKNDFSPQFSHKYSWVARGLPVHQYGSIQDFKQADVSHLLQQSKREVQSILNSLQLNNENNLQIYWLIDEKCLQAGVVPFSLKLTEEVYSDALKRKLQRENSSSDDVDIQLFKDHQDVPWCDLHDEVRRIDRLVVRHLEEVFLLFYQDDTLTRGFNNLSIHP